jgi:hypothetical protein
MTNKVLLGLIVALAIGVVVVGSNDKARQQPAAAITAVSKTTIDSKSDTVGEGEARPATTTDNQPQDISIFTAPYRGCRPYCNFGRTGWYLYGVCSK